MPLKLLLIIILSGSVYASEIPLRCIPEDLIDDQHIRSEFGIDSYTIPSVQGLFQHLRMYLTSRGISYKQVSKKIDWPDSKNRNTASLRLGSLIANGFLAIEYKQNEDLELIVRDIVRQLKVLGLGQKAISIGKNLIAKSSKNDWDSLKKDIIKAQDAIEVEFLHLRDRKRTSLISLGGWLRISEILLYALESKYSLDLAEGIKKPANIAYFLLLINELHPDDKNEPIISKLKDTLTYLLSIMTRESKREILFAVDSEQKSIYEIISKSGIYLQKKDIKKLSMAIKNINSDIFE